MTATELDELGFQLQHDLKDLLRSLALNLEFASQALDSNDVAQSKQVLTTARLSIKKLWGLLDGLTGLSRASQAKADESIQMKDLILGILSELKPIIESQNIVVTVGPMAKAQVDVILIEEVWRQLIENSIRYGNKVTIDAISCGTRTTFYVENNGPEIPKHTASKLFSSLIRPEGEGSGVGLGLLFCRRVIERLGGRIWHERIEDRTRFSFEL